jgi:tRNA modification GTPase
MPGPRSYTGEDVVELSCHGPLCARRDVSQLAAQGARLAEPGDFTRRAYLNGRLSFEAEAVAELISARSIVRAHRRQLETDRRDRDRARRLLDVVARLIAPDFPGTNRGLPECARH